ncbi:MAG: cation:proton antiporter [Phycisphaerales bacterium]|nr:MAG: cation:proton antiporter [Phycisphaerales bacterium]
MNEHLLLPLAGIIILGIAAQWLAWRLRAPSILLLLLVGIAAGPVTGLLNPDVLFGDLLLPVVGLSVALILYEGGLTLRFRELKGANAVLWSLVTIGATVTWLLTAGAGRLILGLSPALAVLLGAVLVVSGPTVILPLLREIRPRGPAAAILKWEGIVIDPIGAMMAVLIFEAILLGGLEEAAHHVALALVKTVLVGGGIGVVAGFLLALLLRVFWIPDYLDNAVSVMFVVGAYAASQEVQPESGLFAATVMGITLANQKLADVRHIVEFKENVRVLLISSLFILLSARIQPEALGDLGWSSLLFLVILLVVVRPASVLVSNLGGAAFGARLPVSTVGFVALIAPRGIVAASVASVFALRLDAAGFAGASALVPLTFLVIVGTVGFCSLAGPPAARWLKVADPNPQGVLLVGADAWARAAAEVLTKRGFRVLLVDTNRRNIAAARLAGLETYSGSILAEYALDEMDLGGLGRLIAATPNDWINVLAVQRMARVFGRSGVYQLPSPEEKKKNGKESQHGHLHGRLAFGADVTFALLNSHASRGATAKATNLTEEYTFESFKEMYGPRAVPMFLIRDDKRLIVVAEDQTTEPKPGDVLISLVDPEEEASRERE